MCDIMFFMKRKYSAGDVVRCGTIVSPHETYSGSYWIKCNDCGFVRVKKPSATGCLGCIKENPRQKHAIGTIVGNKVVVGSPDKKGRYRLKCVKCGAEKIAPVGNQTCSYCNLKYAKGKTLPDGRVIHDVDRSGGQVKLLIECLECQELVWKFNGGKDKPCHGCKARASLIEGRAKAVGKIARAYRYSASKRGYSWDLGDLEVQEIVSQNCRYCGISGTPYVGIDRVDNTLGYTADNCVPCCSVCNMAKGNKTMDEWNEWVGRLVSHHG